MIEDRFMRPEPSPTWLEDEHAEPRPDLAPEQRGPREPQRRIFSFDLTEAYGRVRRWWKDAGPFS